MPALMPTDFTARVVWLGLVEDRETALASEARKTLKLTFAGPEGEDHGGETRASCSRVLSQHPRGTTIRNVRQLAIISREELDLIAGEMGLQALDPAWLGSTMMVEGLPDFTHLPPSSRLQAPDGATLVIDMENRPCNLPAAVIAKLHPEAAKGFKAAAKGRRGVTAWVEREGNLALGDDLRLHVPDQRAWAPTQTDAKMS